ncbi:MAG: penicillin-binding transpeptidase domain-containing protein [Lachnospiraceae bacterium]
MWERIRNKVSEIVKSRVIVVIIVFCVTSAILVQRVFYLQIVKGQEYFDNYKLQIQKTKEVEGTRGNIYDRNGKLLAYNELAYAVTIEDNGEYDTKKQKNKELNKIVTQIIDIVEKNGDTVINDFGIILDNDNKYKFMAESQTRKLRFIADVYGKKTIDELTKKQKNQSAQDIINYLCTDEVYGYGIDQKKMEKEDVLKLVNVRYAISLNSYQKYIATTIAEEVSEETVADIMENMDSLQGVDIEEKSVRHYNNSKCFANIIGYTGQISVEEYDALSKEDKEKYDKNDTVGKAGLEKTMDSTLKGKKGEVKLYVNNVGKVIETVQVSKPKAGNDIYLSIDSDLQVAAYNILEQELAGILLSKIRNVLEYDRTQVSDGSDVIIPIGDVYNAFLSNDILDMNHFAEEDAKETEKEVYDIFSKEKEKILEKLSDILNNPDEKAYKDMSKEWQAYLTYIVTDMLTSNHKIIMSSSIDSNDKTYKAWKTEESINVYTYLNYAISQNWVDTSKLKDYIGEGGKYSDSSEIYEGLKKYIMEQLESNNSFDKVIYKYMIKKGSITGRQICLMLYEQKVLKYDEDQYNRLKAGSLGAYDFIRGKIEDLKITPGQLGLEPCTGSLVMTDTKTGEVLACVSYPGYDNNRLANSMDSDYYNKLVTDQSRPFYNNATQEKTAPGSTYKPLVAIAGLTEGVINLGTYLPCNGVYKKVEPNPKCWAYPRAHGSLNVEGAIEHSCNSFFYEVGYRLSLKDKGISKIGSDNSEGSATTKYYSSTTGTDKLKKYAEMFGLGDVSGVEIPEAEPEISDESSVPSAIGQGTNNYTTTQLARYVTAIANKGTVYDLTLLDKTTTNDGKILEEYEPKVKNTIDEVSDSTWNAVHNGMREVVRDEQNAIFSEINNSSLKLSGKTGTAQQSKTHPDHGLFIGFAPSDDPEVAFAIRIANGYSSHNAAEVGKDLMKYYYKLAPKKEIITGKAKKITDSSGGD